MTGPTAADALAGIPWEANPAPAADAKLDGLNLSAAAARPAAGAAPSWWDAAAGRVALRAADFRGRSLRSANLSGASLERADFSDADFVSGVLRDALLGGASFDRAMLEEAGFGGAHLRFATFREAVLEGADFRAADLWGAKLPEADADQTDFRDAQLEEADFRDADAREADFRGAKLGLTDFRGADLRMADFRGSTPRATKFDGADLRRANLEDLDLSGCSLLGVRLADARLDRTRFHRDQLGPAVGEEVAGDFEAARRAYLSLERNFTDTGDPEAASWAYRRRRRMEKFEAWRRAAEAGRTGHPLRAGRLGLSYGYHKLVELVCDYGESVPRVLLTLGAVLAGYAGWYAAAGLVARDDGTVTRSAFDVARYSLTAMIAPGDPPDDLRPAGPLAQMVTISEGFIGVFLTGLLGFVAGNRIRR